MRGGLRARPRYLGVGDGTRRTTFPVATHPYLSMLQEEEEEEVVVVEGKEEAAPVGRCSSS